MYYKLLVRRSILCYQSVKIKYIHDYIHDVSLKDLIVSVDIMLVCLPNKQEVWA